MKPKSTLRFFLVMASSTLLTITYISASEYYFDTNDSTTGFGTGTGTWAAPTTGTLLQGWSADATGVTSTDTVNVTTGFSDTVNLSTTGEISVSGIVNVEIVKWPSAAPASNLTGGTINFAPVGRIESARANGNFRSNITGAGTSLTIFCNDQNLAFYNSATSTNVNNGAAKTIIQQGATPGQGKLGVAEEQNLGPISSDLEFDGGVLRIIKHATPASQLTSFGARDVTFVDGKNVQFDLNAASLVFTCNKALNQGVGGLIQSGNATGYLILNQTNTYTGTTDIIAGFMSASDSANLGDITAPLSFNGGKLQVTGTSFTSFGTRTVTQIAAKAVDLDIADAANTFTFDKILNGTSPLNKRGIGTLVINQDNTFTATSFATGGGTLVLDYTTNGGSKFSDTNAITLANSDLTLKNGSHPETVSALTLNAGHSHIARDGGSSSINLNGILRAAGGSISLGDGTIATTDLANQTAGILGGWATIGNDWAIRSGAADSLITAFAAYTGALPSTGTGSATANYTLTGDQAQTGSAALAAYTVKIGGTGLTDNTLALAGTTLSVQNATATNLGGILYVGGGTGIYNITADATKGISTSAAQDLIINTVTGTLNVSARINTANGARALLKAGAGTLVLSSSENAYTGATNINQGTLLVNGNQTSANGTTTVYNKAKLGGTGTIGGNAVINSGGGLTFDLITASGSHNSLDLAAGKTLSFPFAGSGGSSTLALTCTAGTAGTGVYTLVTAPGGIIGAVPSTVTLPAGWTAGAPYIDGTSLKINITFAGYAGWSGDNAGGLASGLDFDNDGVENGVEYFMNAVAGLTANPALNSSNAIIWPNGGNILPSAYGTGIGKQYVIQTSSDLSTWTDVPVGSLTTNTAGPGGFLTYTLTGAAPRFVRLKVTPSF